MLDAVGLDPKAGKVTARDMAAVAAMEKPGLQVCKGQNQSAKIMTKEALYKDLSDAKFDKE